MNKLRIVPLGGGPGTVTSNMWLYEYGGEAIIVDCGIGFPEDKVSDDILLPDITYLKTVRPRIHGLILTHGHDDHYAAVPNLLHDLGYPQVYGSKLTAALCQDKLEEFNLKQQVRAIKESDRLQLGPFT